MPLRIWVVGFGTVGQWLVRALDSEAERLAGRYGVGLTVVGLANARDGFVHDENGLDIQRLLGLAAGGRPIGEAPGVGCWPSALEGLRATEADLLVEVTASPSTDGEPGFAHMREALDRRIPVVTSNKWPVALHGVELAELARSCGVAFRGITDIARSQIDEGAARGARLKHVATLEFSEPHGAGDVTAGQGVLGDLIGVARSGS